MAPYEDLVRALFDCGRKQLAADVAALRRDWAVRVLDAWAKGGDSGDTRDWQCQPDIDGGVCFCSVSSYKTGESEDFQAENEDAARHAAAVAVFPTLSDAKRAELGECP